MLQHLRFPVLALVAGSVFTAAGRGDDKASRPPAGCAAAVDNFFEDEVWAKVGARKCLTCHRKGGDAEDSKFVLIDPRKSHGAARDEAMRRNRAAFADLPRLSPIPPSRGAAGHGSPAAHLRAES